MANTRWLKWGMFFSVILFIVIYFLIYSKVANSPTPQILKLGNADVSFLGVFFSNIKNVILSSLVLGFLLGIIAGTSFRKKYYAPNPNQLIRN